MLGIAKHNDFMVYNMKTKIQFQALIKAQFVVRNLFDFSADRMQ